MYLTTVSQVLRLARRLIAERGWAQGELARDANGEPVDPRGQQAVAFCLTGAVVRAARDLAVSNYVRDEAIWRLEQVVGRSVPGFNDAQESVEGVIHAIDEAIALVDRLGRR